MMYGAREMDRVPDSGGPGEAVLPRHDGTHERVVFDERDRPYQVLRRAALDGATDDVVPAP